MLKSLAARVRRALALLFLAALSLPAYAQGSRESTWFWHHGSGWGHTVYGGLMMFLVWGAIGVLIVLGVRWFRARSEANSRSRRKALEVLEERFARGDIDEEEFRQRKNALSG